MKVKKSIAVLSSFLALCSSLQMPNCYAMIPADPHSTTLSPTKSTYTVGYGTPEIYYPEKNNCCWASGGSYLVECWLKEIERSELSPTEKLLSEDDRKKLIYGRSNEKVLVTYWNEKLREKLLNARKNFLDKQVANTKKLTDMWDKQVSQLLKEFSNEEWHKNLLDETFSDESFKKKLNENSVDEISCTRLLKIRQILLKSKSQNEQLLVESLNKIKKSLLEQLISQELTDKLLDENLSQILSNTKLDNESCAQKLNDHFSSVIRSDLSNEKMGKILLNEYVNICDQKSFDDDKMQNALRTIWAVRKLVKKYYPKSKFDIQEYFLDKRGYDVLKGIHLATDEKQYEPKSGAGINQTNFFYQISCSTEEKRFEEIENCIKQFITNGYPCLVAINTSFLPCKLEEERQANEMIKQIIETCEKYRQELISYCYSYYNHYYNKLEIDEDFDEDFFDVQLKIPVAFKKDATKLKKYKYVLDEFRKTPYVESLNFKVEDLPLLNKEDKKSLAFMNNIKNWINDYYEDKCTELFCKIFKTQNSPNFKQKDVEIKTKPTFHLVMPLSCTLDEAGHINTIKVFLNGFKDTNTNEEGIYNFTFNEFKSIFGNLFALTPAKN